MSTRSSHFEWTLTLILPPPPLRSPSCAFAHSRKRTSPASLSNCIRKHPHSPRMQSILDQLCAAAAQSPDALADESFARALDAQDKVIRREEFAYPQLADGSGDCVYLCGNSLGLQPLSARAYVNQELDAWAKCAHGFFVPSSRCCSAMFSTHIFLQKTTALCI